MSTPKTIALHDVESSQIYAIGHDAKTSTLAVRFTKGYGVNRAPGSLYHYANVTTEEFQAFKDADSIGKHFGQHIKPFSTKYPYQKIDELASLAA